MQRKSYTGLVNLTQPMLFVAEKIQDYEPEHNFFHNF